jgi:LacI family transcriptional regulator
MRWPNRRASPPKPFRVRDRVKLIAESLGYTPNLSARRLRGAGSQLIIALVDAALTLDHLRSEHGSNFLDRFQLGAMMRCRDSGFHLMVELVEVGRPDAGAQIFRLMTKLKPDGVILTPPSSDDASLVAVLERLQVAYVRLGPEQEVDRGYRVYMDDFAAAHCMTDHLIGLGHRDIGLIVGSASYPAAHLRRSGFEAAMRDRGLSVPPDRIRQGDFTFASGQACARVLLQTSRPPTAIFASSDEMALGVIHMAVDLGLSIPQDLSVVGFDDIVSARFSIPPLTTIRQPVAEMSYAAADILIKLQAVKLDELPPADTLLPFQLIVRGSAGPVAPLSVKQLSPPQSGGLSL